MEETLMAKSSNYRVKLRRRRAGKTDYQARKALVISGKPRLVVRASIKNITVQVLIAKPIGDMVLAAANSLELVKMYGWKAPTGNVPAAYLTGYLCGLKAKAKGVQEAILDLGLVSPTKGSKSFAALSGILDAGVNVPHSGEKIVKERLRGDHIAKYGKSLGAGSEEYSKKFSQYTAEGVAPEKIVEYFNKVKADMPAVLKSGKPVVEAAPKAEAPKKAAVKEAAEAPKPEAKAPAKIAKASAKGAKAPVKEKAKAKEAKPKKEKAPAKAKAPAKEKAPKEKAAKKGEKKE
jgi:large subunit ribosomal protein L18